ncbi:MAG: polyphenol oxidase family protein [Desulfonatronovibrio sp.]
MSFLQFRFPGVPNVLCAFGSRLGGVSCGAWRSSNISFEVEDSRENVESNRRIFKKELGFKRVVELKQVHGSDILFDPEGDFISGSDIPGDGAGISTPDTAVMIKTADCQPVFLVHESGGYACGLHVGWRGNRAHFPLNGVREFCNFYRISPGDVLAVRGPSLGPCCAEFDDFSRHWTDEFRDYYDFRTRCMNLWSLTRRQLILAGLKPDNIYSVDLCTRCHEDLFFSYRREKICGRLGNFVVIHEGAKPCLTQPER